MLLLLLLFIPLCGVFSLSTAAFQKFFPNDLMEIKIIALTTSIINVIISLIIFIFYNFSLNLFQFLQDFDQVKFCDFYSGLDGISIYFVLITTIITPIALLSNWNSIKITVRAYAIIILLLETLLLAVFLLLDAFLFYIFFESILPPLFILIGLFGSDERVRASFYLFLYTLLGSLFLLLAILTMSSLMGTTDYDILFKSLFEFDIQKFLFIGIFIAFAVKTPVIFLNLWLLKAHVESPLGGSIFLAAIVLKLSLYGIFRLMLPLIAKATLIYGFLIFAICVVTIIYASISTLRTIDFKEIVAYSSVAHAAVYLMGAFSNSVIGIEGAILLGLGHAFASSGLFISVGGILYDRCHTRLISLYRGMAQLLPMFTILLFILCLANMGTPLTFNFIGEFLSLYGAFESNPILGSIACSSIVLSAAFTIYLFNRIAFGGYYSKHFTNSFPDLNKREYTILLILAAFIVILGVYPAIILDGLHFSVSTLIYSYDYSNVVYSTLVLGFNKKIFLRTFSTTSHLMIDGNDSEESSDSEEPSDDEGYKTDDSDRGNFENYGTDVYEAEPSTLKDDQLREAIMDANTIANDSEFCDNDQTLQQEWRDRRDDLIREWSNRGHLGPLPPLPNSQIVNPVPVSQNNNDGIQGSNSDVTPEVQNNPPVSQNFEDNGGEGSSSGITPQIIREIHDRRRARDHQDTLNQEVENNLPVFQNLDNNGGEGSSSGITPQIIRETHDRTRARDHQDTLNQELENDSLDSQEQSVPSKRFKQDSSDISSDSELSDYTWGSED